MAGTGIRAHQKQKLVSKRRKKITTDGNEDEDEDEGGKGGWGRMKRGDGVQLNFKICVRQYSSSELVRSAAISHTRILSSIRSAEIKKTLLRQNPSRESVRIMKKNKIKNV